MRLHGLRSGAVAALAALLVASASPLLAPGTARAQNPHPATPTDGPSSLPVGPGTIRGVVVDANAPGATAGLNVALYALQPDGTPGIGAASVGEDGSFVFENVAVDPAIVYLVGIRYADVPYGERTSFSAGQDVLDLALPVQRPSADGSHVQVLESSVRVESLGTRLAVEEIHKVDNPDRAPVLVPAAQRGSDARAPFEALLPEGATHFQAGMFDNSEAFAREGSRLLFWGPVYPGNQEIRFSYQLPIPPGTDELQIELRFPRGTGRARLLSSPLGPKLMGAALRAAKPREAEAGQRVFETDSLAAGGALTLTVEIPETVDRPDAISLGRAELAIELDDAWLEVTQSQVLAVAPGAPVAGRPGAALLRFELPQRAELVSLSTDAGRLGVRSAEQGVEVLGPLAPGNHDFAFRYRMPADPGATELGLRFPRTVSTLLVRAADTGLVIESDRLHRLRPQAIGTRTWMMREAFHVEPDEIVSLRFVPLPAPGPSKLAALFFVISAAAIVLLFVVAPLRAVRQVRGPEEEDRQGPAHERDLIYATIRDLEHDFETGKVANDDYQRSRDELWARAKELMRRDDHAVSAAEARPEAAVSSALDQTGGFCPACGKPVEAGWQFCSRCGGNLRPLAGAGESEG